MVSEPTTPHRPRISRETRRLLAAAFIALAALWVLARLRFPDQAATPNPVPRLLTQIVTPPTFADLSSQLGQLQGRLRPALVALPPDLSETRDMRLESRLPGLRFRADIAIALLGRAKDARQTEQSPTIATDPGSGLTLIRVEPDGTTLVPATWSPRRPDQPRYLMATTLDVGRSPRCSARGARDRRRHRSG